MYFTNDEDGAACQRRFVRVILAVIFVASLFRLLLFALKFGQAYLQPDFAAYFTAGEALNADLSVYLNWVGNDPPVWDGTAQYVHSRFLYPPLAGALFQPVALLPYAIMKHAWTFLSLGCVSAGMVLAARKSRVTMSLESLLVIGIFVCLYLPLMIHLERGQGDAVTFLLLMAAIGILMTSKGGYSAGLLLAGATLLKLNCIYFIPFLLISKKWKALTGYLAGGLILLILTFIFTGIDPLEDYVFEELPRITSFGEIGSPDVRIDESVFDDLPIGYKDGNQYIIPENLGFAFSGSLAWYAKDFFSRLGVGVSMSTLSVILYLCFFLLIWVWQVRFQQKNSHVEPMKEFAYWQIVLIVILLISPMTWVMNTIWLMPAIVIFIFWYVNLKEKAGAYFLALGAAGLLLAAIPDHAGYLQIIPFGVKLIYLKYIIAEIMLMGSLLNFISRAGNKHAGAPVIEPP